MLERLPSLKWLALLTFPGAQGRLAMEVEEAERKEAAIDPL